MNGSAIIKLTFTIFIYFTYFPSIVAATGGWTSGGGILRSSKQNPWFLQNTTKVTFCIDIDESNFGQSRDVVLRKVKRALLYWQNQFTMGNPQASSIETPSKTYSYKVILGTQEFIEAPCHSNIDLRFQFGVLSNEQEHYLQNPASIVGITVRTEYDEAQLRGKGFIYISPEDGRLALKFDRLLPSRWKFNDGMLLELLLIHELGHVFGIPHFGTFMDLMSEGFPELLVDRAWSELFKSVRKPQDLLTSSSNYAMSSCSQGMGLMTENILGIPQSWQCFKIEMRNHQLSLYAAETSEQAFQLIGQSVQSRDIELTINDIIGTIFLPESQLVFEVPSHVKVLSGAYHRITFRDSQSVILTPSNEKIEMIVTKSPEYLYIDAGKNGMPLRLKILKLDSYYSFY